MTEYVLTYGRPRVRETDGAVIYESQMMRREFVADEFAVNWVCEVLPYEMGLTHRGKRHLAAPIRCRRADRRAQAVVWETAA